MLAEEHKVLLLNATYEPMKILTWQRAIVLWFEKKVDIIEEYPDFELKSANHTMCCPAVLRLTTYVKPKKEKIKFSRMNVFARDNYTCQYCNKPFTMSKLTYDHVLPRSKGGKTVWDNITTSCLTCNSKKADRTPAEAKMRLHSVPTKPDWSPKKKVMVSLSNSPKEWKDYLYWNLAVDES